MDKEDMKFKEAQKVRVVKCTGGHEFKIGEVVKVVFADPEANDGEGDYKCSNGVDSWYLGDEELEAFKTHENQSIQDFARQVAKTVKEDWGSHNVDEFVEAFKREVGR